MLAPVLIHMGGVEAESAQQVQNFLLRYRQQTISQAGLERFFDSYASSSIAIGRSRSMYKKIEATV